MRPFLCSQCGQTHNDFPSFHANHPALYWEVPEDKRASDVFLTTDSCVIADRFFFVRGVIEIPIHDYSDPFLWGVWVSLSEANFFLWQDHYEVPLRSHIGPFFGWLSTSLPLYPDTLNLKTMVHLRDHGLRPRIVLEPTEHPLSTEQHHGISLERVGEMVHILLESQGSPETPDR